MPNTSSNVVLYATLAQRWPAINLANGLTTTTTLIVTATSTAAVLTDVLFRSADAAVRTFGIIICATGSQATAENERVVISVPALSGNNGTTAICSLAALVPSLFDIDLAGNRVITLESGFSLYAKNLTTLSGAFFITPKTRDY